MAKEKSIVRPSEKHKDCFELCRPNGEFLALIDAADVDVAVQYRWHTSRGYVARTWFPDRDTQTMELLHRRIAENAGETIKNAEVRFKNRNQRDCRRENLKIVPCRPRKRRSN